MPRVCFNINYDSINQDKFDINIIFNDYHMTKVSSFFKNTKYQYKLYKYSFFNEPSYYDLFQNKYHEITVKQLTNNRNIKSVHVNDLIQLENLDIGMYLLEIIVVENSSFCHEINMCAAEDDKNNQIKCVECSKLVVYFLLEENMLNNNDDFSNDKMKSSNKEIDSNKIKEVNLNKDVTFKCSIDNEISVKTRKFRSFDRKKFVKYDIYSLVLPLNFSVSDLLMPYFKINIPTKNGLVSIFTMFALVFGLFFILVLFLIIFVILYLEKYKQQCIIFKIIITVFKFTSINFNPLF